MLNRSSAPAFNNEFSFELPQPEIISINDDLDLVWLKNIQQEVFKLEFIFKAGKWHEQKIGLSHFTATMLDKGTKDKSSKKIAELLDYYGAQIEISPGYDFTSISIYGLKKYFGTILPLFMEMISSPVFPQEEFDIQKEIFIQNLKINNEKSSIVASKLIRKNIFGSNHPYGSSIEEHHVTDLSTSDLHDYFNEQFYPHEIYLLSSHASSELELITNFVSALKKRKSINDEKTFVVFPELLHQKIVKENGVQSSIRLGKRIVNRNHPDYFSLLLLNHILGGYFGSRLMKNIREEKGLTYGIYSSIHPFKNDCLFSIGADVGKEKLELALTEIKKELNNLSQKPIEDGELNIVKYHFLGSLQLELANPFSSIEKIKTIRLNHLDTAYYKNLFRSIQQLTDKDIAGTASHFSPQNLLEVSVG